MNMFRSEGDLPFNRTLTLAVATAFFFTQASTSQDQVQKNTKPKTEHSLPTSTDKPEFDVESVRQNKSDVQPFMNINPTLADGPVPDGGLYLARNIKLIQFIAFAYKLTQIQLQSVVSQVPWTNEEFFDIEARSESNPTKEQYRLMMQSLLEDRFKLKVHYETRMLPVYALTLATPGRLGPHLRVHRADDPFCAATPSQAISKPPAPPNYQVDRDGYPEACGGPLSMTPSSSDRMKSGGRNVPMSRFAAVITGVGAVDRPLVDKTGIEGNIDYFFKWEKAPAQVSPGAQLETDISALPFKGAMKAELGINMVSEDDPVEVFLIDHIEHPTPN